jgi:hypothetical protein
MLGSKERWLLSEHEWQHAMAGKCRLGDNVAHQLMVKQSYSRMKGGALTLSGKARIR